MPTVTVQLPKAMEHIMIDGGSLLDKLMKEFILSAIQEAFFHHLGSKFGPDKVTVRLDTSTVIYSNKIILLIECFDSGAICNSKRSAIEETAGLYVHSRIRCEMDRYDGWVDINMPSIDVRLSPRQYSMTVTGPKGTIVQRVPKLPEGEAG